MESSENCKFENNNAPRTLSDIDNEKTNMIGNDDKHGVKNSFLVKKANFHSEGKSGFTIASVSNINVRRFKIKKAGGNVTGDSNGAESDYEISSTSFPGSYECMDSCHLSRPDRLLLKEMTRRHYAVLSKDNAVSDLALDLFGRKTMEKPQMMRKARLTPSVSRLIRKSKLVSDKNDANSGNISAVKSLSASARERLLNEVKDMDKKIRERNLLRLIQSYEDEHWTAMSEDYKSRLIESMKGCLCKDWTKENEPNDLKITIKDDKTCGSVRRTINRNAIAKTSHQEKKSDQETIYIPETRTMASFATAFPSGSTNKKAKSLPRKVQQDNLAQLWSKQTFAAAIAKQLTDERNILDISKAFNVEKQKTAQSSCKMSNHLDATSNSTTAIDFSINLDEFDINSFPDEIQRLREEGKLKKLLKQAVGLKQNKTGVSAKVDCKYDDGKRVESDFGDSKEELFGYQIDNIGDLTDDDDVGTDDEWSDCEVPDEQQHPHRHHSCDNKTKNKRTASGTGRDGRHGHCDCCYCEMFGHAATESIKSGRAQIRERLRMKLKRRNVQEHSGTNTKSLREKLTCATTNQDSEKSLAVVPDTPIEEILDYINEKDIAAAQIAASKAAKRARQKLRRQEEKVRQNRERKLKEEQKKAVEAELLKKKKEQQAAQEEVKKEKQSKPGAKKKKTDRVRRKKQKDSRDRKKETELQLSRSQEVEVRKEMILEFEYWNDPKCSPEFKRMGSMKEQIGTSKVGRMRTQNKEESKKHEGVAKRFELEKKESEKENASSKKEVIEADSAVENNYIKSSKNESSGVNSGTTFPIRCITMFSKTEDYESEETSLHIQPAMKLLLDEELDASSTDMTVSEASTVLSELELMSQFPKLNCPITKFLSPKMPPLPQNISEMSLMRPAGFNTNISQRFPFPVLPVSSPSQVNTLGLGTSQQGVSYYTHFGGQRQIYLINGINQCLLSSPNQNALLLPSASANFAQDPILRPLRTPQGLGTRTCQIGINDAINISGQYSLPSLVNSSLTDMLQKAGPISPVPVFDAKSYQTTTNFSSFGSQKPLYTSESSSLSSLSSPVSSSSSKPALCGTPLSLREFDVISFKGSTKTARMPSPGIMSLPLQNDLCSNKGTAQKFSGTNIVAKEFTLSDSLSCPKQHIPNIAVPVCNIIPDSLPVPTQDLLYFTSLEQDVITAKVQKSSQYINAQFLVSHQNGMLSTIGNVSNAAELNKIRTGGALPGSSQFTAAVRAKRSEACKTFLSSSSPLADYDSETRKLAAFAKQDEIFHNQNPMIFEPGDPRIAVAIAEMKFDPHETFKPRPDSELEFLDPLELEVEHFKRVLWEEEQLTRPRVPLRELRKIDPENEPDAVFHFAPLV